MRRLLCSILAAVLVLASAPVAHAEELMVAQETITGWYHTRAGATVYLEITVDREFTATDLVTRQPGWRQLVPCTVTEETLGSGEVIRKITIEGFNIWSTTDAPIGSKDARYRARFVDSRGRELAPYAGFEHFRVPSTFATGTTGRWSDIRTFNVGPVQPQYDLTYYSREETNRLIAQTVALAGGVGTINGVTDTIQTLQGGTNISVVTAGSAHTFNLTGTVALANGGTGAATPAGARTNLGAAASGANADITQLTGLTTALGPQFGGTGFLGGYSVGDTLFATGASAIGRRAIGAANTVYVSDGTAPQWSTSLTLSSLSSASLTVTGLTPGRVPYVGAADAVLDDSLLLWDATNNRLSVATNLSSEAINLPLDGYVGGTTIGGASITKMIGSRTVNRVTGMVGTGYSTVFSTTNDTGTDVSPNQILVHRYTDATAAAVNALAPSYQIGTGGMRVTHALGASYDESAASNVFALSSFVRNIGSSPTVAVFGEALATGDQSQAFGGNFVAYVDTAALTTNASAKGVEVNYGYIDSNGLGAAPTGGGALGVLIASAGFGAGDAHLVMQSNSALSSPNIGIWFNTGLAAPPIQSNGVLLSLSGGAKIGAARGIDLAGATYTSGAFNASSSDVTSGYRINAASDLENINVAALNQTTSYGTNVLQFGSALPSGPAIDAMIFDTDADGETGEVFRLMGTTARAALNAPGLALAHQLTIRPTTTRSLAGTVATTAASTTVSGTGTAFTEELRPGSSFVVNGVTYEVDTITDDDTLDLTTAAASTLVGQSVLSDSPMLLIESEEGVDFLEMDANGTVVLFDDASNEFGAPAPYSDYEGALQIRSRPSPAKRLVFGYDDTNDAAFISSIVSEDGGDNLSWGNLILNGGSQTGYVGVGTAYPSALFSVDGSGAKTADFIGSAFNNTATSTAAFTKVGATFTLTTFSNEWVGVSRGLQVDVTNSRDTSYNRTGYPAVLHGGGVLIAPPQSTGPIYAPEAMLHVYGYRQTQIAGSDVDADTVTTTGATQINAAGTVSFATLEPGQAVSFGTETGVSEIDYFDATTPSGTAYLTAAKGAATYNQAYVDPPLFRFENGAGTDRLTLTSGGRLTLNGALFLHRVASALEPDVAETVSLRTSAGGAFNKTGNIFHVASTGNNLTTLADGTDGQIVVLVFDGAVTVEDSTGNINLAGTSVNYAAAANSVLTLLYDSDLAAWVELSRSDNAN
jgi:hypothetical protein